MKWDISKIPAGSTVLRAWISVYNVNRTASTYDIYELKRDWQEMEVTWTKYAGDGYWEVAGANGSTDRGLVSLGHFSYDFNGLSYTSLNMDGVQVVQSWIDNPSTNFGVVIMDYADTDLLAFSSREEIITERHPKLTVQVQLAPPHTPGEASPPGYSFIARKGTDTSIEVDYEPAGCCSDHTIYWASVAGPLSTSLTWTGQACFRGSSGQTTFDPGTLQPGMALYFVIVGTDGFFEGSYGLDSAGNERLEATEQVTCDYPRDLTDNCPGP